MMLEGGKRVNPGTWAQTLNALLGGAMRQRECGGRNETDLVEPWLCHRKTESSNVGLCGAHLLLREPRTAAAAAAARTPWADGEEVNESICVSACSGARPQAGLYRFI